MTEQTTQWGPGLMVLAAGVVLSLIYLFLSSRKQDGKGDQKEKVAELDLRAQSLIEQLKELNEEKHHIDPARYEAEKSRLEKEAAAAFRARAEAIKSPTASAQPKASASGAKAQAPQAPAPAGNPALRGALWGGGVVAFFVILGIVLTQEQTERQEGQGMTGRAPSQMGGAAPQMPQAEDPMVTAARIRFEQNPKDVGAAVELEHLYLSTQQFDMVDQMLVRSLALDPFNLEVRIHRAALTAIRGSQPEFGLAELRRLSDTYPDAQEALLWAGAITLELGDKVGALNLFERFLDEAPANTHPPRMREGLAALRQELSGAPPPRMPPTITPEMMEKAAAARTPEMLKQLEKTIADAEDSLAQGKYNDALEGYRQVMPLMPENNQAKAGMAWALVSLDRQPMADRVWTVTVESDPSALDQLADRLKAKGDAAGAKKVWSRLSESAPSYAEKAGLRAKAQ